MGSFGGFRAEPPTAGGLAESRRRAAGPAGVKGAEPLNPFASFTSLLPSILKLRKTKRQASYN